MKQIESLMAAVEAYALSKDGRTQQWAVDAKRADVIAEALDIVHRAQVPVQFNAPSGSVVVISLESYFASEEARNKWKRHLEQSLGMKVVVLECGARLSAVITKEQAGG